MNIAKLQSAGISLALVLVSAVAKADTITQNFTVVFQNTPQTAENTKGFLQFNPALGTLNSVTASFTGNIDFIASASDGKYTVAFDRFAGGGGSELFFSDTTSSMFQTNTPVDPGAVTAQNGFVNYFITDLDLEVTDGVVLAGSTATGSLTYNYTPAAVTPEPSSLLLAGTALLGCAAQVRRRFGH